MAQWRRDIGQALALNGVRPVWDGPTRRHGGLGVITAQPAATAAGDVHPANLRLFRDAFPAIDCLMNQATGTGRSAG